MNVLSLFDGMSCGQIALERAGIKVNNYFASEIDKYAQIVSKANYPGIIRLGDVTKWKEWELPKIDLLLAGFPCQAWSIAGKQKGLDDPRGKLALVLVEIFEHFKRLNPDMKFLFENVRMKKENLDYMDNLFGIEHIKINSSLLSAQNRLRCYWTNIEGVEQPEDKGILLKDIVHENCDNVIIDGKFIVYPDKYVNFISKDFSIIDDYNQNLRKNGKSCTLTTNSGSSAFRNGQKISISLNKYIVPFDKTLQILDKEVERGKVGYFRKDSQANRVYYIHDKAVTLCGEVGGGAAKMGQYLFGEIIKKSNGGVYKKDIVQTVRVRKFDVDVERLKKVLIEYKAKSGLTVKEIADILKANKTKVDHWFRKDECFSIPNPEIWIELKKLLCISFDDFDKSIITFEEKPNVYETANRVYFPEGKSPTLTSVSCDKMIFGCITPDRINKRQNGQRFSEGKKFYTLTAQDKHGILIEGYIRKLTPIECERLQTVPDNFTNHVSNSQRYKMLGNGWTVDVIAHILKSLGNS